MTTFGVDLGGTNVRCAAVDATGRVLAEAREPRPEGWDAVVACMARLVGEFAAGFPDGGAIGVGAAGLVDLDGIVHFAPNIPGLLHAPLRAELAAATGRDVVVDNDGNAAAWGELLYGAARGFRDALVITLGTGIGGAIIADGRVYRGAHGFAAELGHWQVDPHGPRCACGLRGHWESFASGTALASMGRERAASGRAAGLLAAAGGDADAVTGVLVGERATAGDLDARELIAEFAEHVAIGLAGLAAILDPALIVVSGGLVELGDVLLDPLRRAFSRHLEAWEHRPQVDIVPAALGERAGVIGAAAMARGAA